MHKAWQAINLLRLTPLQFELPISRGALAKIDVDKTLIWNADLFRNALEIVDASLVQSNGDLLL